MTGNTQFRRNVINSFEFAKKDISNLYEHIKVLYAEIEQLKAKNVRLSKKSTKKTLVASKTGKKVHNSACTFGKKIKASNILCFATKTEAEKLGFKPCSCLA